MYIQGLKCNFTAKSVGESVWSCDPLLPPISLRLTRGNHNSPPNFPQTPPLRQSVHPRFSSPARHQLTSSSSSTKVGSSVLIRMEKLLLQISHGIFQIFHTSICMKFSIWIQS